MVIPHTVTKLQILDTEWTACHCVTSTNKFDNHVFKCSNENENVVNEPHFYALLLLWFYHR